MRATNWLASVVVALAIMAGAPVGSSSADESGKKKRGDPAKAFQRLDKDADGALTVAEFTGKKEPDAAKKAAARFPQIDTNHDGKLSLVEFTAALRQ